MQEGEDRPTPRRRRRPGLKTVGQCRHELADLYRAGRGGGLDPLAASRLATIVVAIARLLEGAELEARVAELERRMTEGKKRGST